MELEIRNLSKTYGNGVVALDNINIVLKPGIYGLLGPNGAGKTTLINILTDNLKESTGDVFLDGVSIHELGKEYRRKLGYMPQNQRVYSGFSLRRFLLYMASLKGMKRKAAGEKILEIAERVNLKNSLDKKMGAFSGGMRQRALLAQALLGDPDIIILDEPTAGLDPKERIRIRNLIAEIAVDKIVIIATHVVTDIEFIANKILLLKRGSLIIQETPEVLINKLNGRVFERRCDISTLDEIYKKCIVSAVSRFENEICVRYLSDDEGELGKAVRPSLEEVYLDYFDKDELNE